MFEKLAYSLKGRYSKIKGYFTSPKFLRFYDKTMKILKNIVPKLVMVLILLVFSYIFMSPLLRVLVDSVKNKEDITNPDIVWIPSQLSFNNFLDACKGLWLWHTDSAYGSAVVSTLWNSVLFSFIAAVFQTFIACTAGYAFARFNFKGKKFWFFGLILAFILPIQLLTLPRSMMLQPFINATANPASFFGVKDLNSSTASAVNSNLAVVSTFPILLITLLGQGLNSSILIFIAFSFFKMIPIALDEAAQIDGANFFKIFYHIILKMSIPTILVIFLFSFIWNWNDTYQLSRLVGLSADQLAYKSLPQALGGFNYLFSQGSHTSGVEQENNVGLQGAAIIISILPLIILYAFTQRKFVEGIENTGVTGV